MSDFEQRKYLALTLDPIHIGEGGYRLGRVDNTIVREPATNVPKIPGTSLAGAFREYAQRQNEEVEEVFGTTEKQSKIRFYDAQIVLFPVRSSRGTVWITTFERIKELFLNIGKERNAFKEETAYLLKGFDDSVSDIDLGWILLEAEKKDIEFEDKKNELIALADKIAMVSEWLFSELVNDNLEVRTSVKIDSETGAAVDGALFTYEAIPRGTFLMFEIYCEDVSKTEKYIESALKYIKVLGLGGMGTRGFGRLDINPFTETKNPANGGEQQ